MWIGIPKIIYYSHILALTAMPFPPFFVFSFYFDDSILCYLARNTSMISFWSIIFFPFTSLPSFLPSFLPWSYPHFLCPVFCFHFLLFFILLKDSLPIPFSFLFHSHSFLLFLAYNLNVFPLLFLDISFPIFLILQFSSYSLFSFPSTLSSSLSLSFFSLHVHRSSILLVRWERKGERRAPDEKNWKDEWTVRQTNEFESIERWKG